MPHDANDNDAYPPARPNPIPDAHGQAALLLVESLIFGLIERSVISIDHALEIVDAAAEVKSELAIDFGEPPEAADRSLALLAAISDSLRQDA